MHAVRLAYYIDYFCNITDRIHANEAYNKLGPYHQVQRLVVLRHINSNAHSSVVASKRFHIALFSSRMNVIS